MSLFAVLGRLAKRSRRPGSSSLNGIMTENGPVDIIVGGEKLAKNNQAWSNLVDYFWSTSQCMRLISSLNRPTLIFPPVVWGFRRQKSTVSVGSIAWFIEFAGINCHLYSQRPRPSW